MTIQEKRFAKSTLALCVVLPVVFISCVYLTAADHFSSSGSVSSGSKLGHEANLRRNQVNGLMYGGIYEPVLSNFTKRAAIILLLNEELKASFSPAIKQLHRVLMEQGLRYGLYTVQEYRLPRENYSDEFLQNWGALFNAAVLEIVKYNSFDCFFFHDFSIFSIVFNASSYQCPEEGVVVQSSSKTKTVTYEEGYLAFTKDDFMRMNGFSNCYPYDSTVAELALRMDNFNLTLKTLSAALNKNSKTSFNATRLARDGLSSVEYVLQAVDVSKAHTSYQFSLKEKNYIQRLCRF